MVSIADPGVGLVDWVGLGPGCRPGGRPDVACLASVVGLTILAEDEVGRTIALGCIGLRESASALTWSRPGLSKNLYWYSRSLVRHLINLWTGGFTESINLSGSWSHINVNSRPYR